MMQKKEKKKHQIPQDMQVGNNPLITVAMTAVKPIKSTCSRITCQRMREGNAVSGIKDFRTAFTGNGRGSGAGPDSKRHSGGLVKEC